ncbi:hypothetical protein SAMN05443246_2207 [Paenibacillus sp. GP183]|nr:hypothetical protein [Paenibacillus sp. GP183]SEB87556.1 hypothetical protein SAMN05443246_2207 [Paenibacillus sp. GP183]
MDANRAVFCARWFTEAKSAAVRLADLIIVLTGICVTGQNDYQQNKENQNKCELTSKSDNCGYLYSDLS